MTTTEAAITLFLPENGKNLYADSGDEDNIEFTNLFRNKLNLNSQPPAV